MASKSSQSKQKRSTDSSQKSSKKRGQNSAQVNSRARSIASHKSNVVLVYVTFPNLKIAEQVSKKLILEKICACANFWSGQSVYFWKGKVESGSEVFGLLKTSKTCLKSLKKRYFAEHPYENPCWIELPTNAVAENYQNWLESMLK